MFTILAIIHIIICLCLCVVVLLQSSKGGGLSGAFGGGGGLPQQMFGSKAMTTALHKITIYLAVGFFLTSALLFMLTADQKSNQGSAVKDMLQDGETVSGQAPVPEQPITSSDENNSLSEEDSQ